MNTPRVNWNPQFTKQLVESGAFRDHPFCLVDVGASGGIDGYWEIFGDDLRAVGFDGLIDEVERLSATAGSQNRKYYPYLVGDKNYQAPAGVPDTQVFPRASATRAAEIINCNYVRAYFDKTGSGLSATQLIELDQFVLRDHPMDVDFIKVDTDGSDYQVLRGAKELRRETLFGPERRCRCATTLFRPSRRLLERVNRARYIGWRPLRSGPLRSCAISRGIEAANYGWPLGPLRLGLIKGRG